jgi:hypothetical protein
MRPQVCNDCAPGISFLDPRVCSCWTSSATPLKIDSGVFCAKAPTLGFRPALPDPEPTVACSLIPLAPSAGPGCSRIASLKSPGLCATSFALVASLGGSDCLACCGGGHASESKCAPALPCLIPWHVRPAIATLSPLPTPKVWQIICGELRKRQKQYRFRPCQKQYRFRPC